jgi:hypothetical protein
VSTTAVVVAAGLVAVVTFLGLALAGLVRTVEGLRRRVDALEASPPVQHPAAGLPVGAPAPVFHATTARGASFRSATLAGRRHVIALADPGCEACERLVPDLLAGAQAGELPTCVIVVAGPDAGTWTVPPGAEERAILVLDPGTLVADAFGSGFTPHAFVVDEGGSVAAQGPAWDLTAVRRLLREAEGVHILRSEAVEALDG